MSSFSTGSGSGSASFSSSSYSSSSSFCNYVRVCGSVVEEFPLALHSFIVYCVRIPGTNDKLEGVIQGGPSQTDPLPYGYLVSTGSAGPNSGGIGCNDVAGPYFCKYALVLDLLGAAAAYGQLPDNPLLLYHYFPEVNPGKYNSNSYIRGILNATGASASAPGFCPGWLKPIPLIYTPQYQNNEEICR